MTRLDEVKTEMNNAVQHAGQGHPKTLWSKFYLKGIVNNYFIRQHNYKNCIVQPYKISLSLKIGNYALMLWIRREQLKGNFMLHNRA